MEVGIIGLGLIGSSIAVTLKESNFSERILGNDENPEHALYAHTNGIVDDVASFDRLINESELIIIATPVNAAITVLLKVLDKIDGKTVIDVGSTKEAIVDAAANHLNRERFVATHPIWGTEYSGPSAAVCGGMKDRIAVICNREESADDAVKAAEALYSALEMKIQYMDAKAHDVHAAFVSHISHLTSFALALSVLEKEREEEEIFRLAGGGFESTVRLAKSNPDTWVPIFEQNRSNVLDVLNEQIHFLRQMKKLLEMEEYSTLHRLLSQANAIKKIIK